MILVTMFKIKHYLLSFSSTLITRNKTQVLSAKWHTDNKRQQGGKKRALTHLPLIIQMLHQTIKSPLYVKLLFLLGEQYEGEGQKEDWRQLFPSILSAQMFLQTWCRRPGSWPNEVYWRPGTEGKAPTKHREQFSLQLCINSYCC